MKIIQKKRISFFNDYRGFTLIEVLVAMALLTIVLLGGAVLTTGIVQGNTQSNQMATACILTQEKLEAKQGLGYSGTSFTNTTVIEDYNTIPDFPEYKRVTETEIDTPGPARKKVTVTVYWNSDEKFVTLQSIIAKAD